MLVKLPAEIRKHVYDMVLGGNTIHASGYEREVKCPEGKTSMNSIARTLHCQACDDDVLDATEYEQKGSADAEKMYEDRHSSCALECLDSNPDKPSPPKFDVGFLTVCRQIYQEAALIPFAANTFSFRDTSDACKFINAIKPEQTQAISSIVYASYLCGTREEAYERLVARGFKRLNTFVVCRIFEENILVGIDPVSDDDEESDAGKDEAGERKTAEVEKKKRKHDQVSDEPEERFKTKRIG